MYTNFYYQCLRFSLAAIYARILTATYTWMMRTMVSGHLLLLFGLYCNVICFVPAIIHPFNVSLLLLWLINVDAAAVAATRGAYDDGDDEADERELKLHLVYIAAFA